MVEDWLKASGAVIPAADANVEAADAAAATRARPSSAAGPTRRVWRVRAVFGAVRMATPTRTEWADGEGRPPMPARPPPTAPAAIERRADGDAVAEGARRGRARATRTVGAAH